MKAACANQNQWGVYFSIIPKIILATEYMSYLTKIVTSNAVMPARHIWLLGHHVFASVWAVWWNRWQLSRPTNKPNLRAIYFLINWCKRLKTQCQDEFRSLSGSVTEILTAWRMLQILIAWCQIQDEIHTFPTMYIMGGGNMVKIGQKHDFFLILGLKTPIQWTNILNIWLRRGLWPKILKCHHLWHHPYKMWI